jgi:NAD/NADP transhydrogenase beta subunit
VETAAAESEDSLIPATVTQISCYLMISFLFIYALNRFTSVADAKKGLYFVFFATVFAIIITFFTPDWD